MLENLIKKKERTSENSLNSSEVHKLIDKTVQFNLTTLNNHLKNCNDKFEAILKELHELRQKTNITRSEAVTNQRTKKGVKK